VRNRASEELALQEESHRERERSLSDDQLLRYRQEIKRHVKDPDTYAVLVYGLGFGLHHLYLGRWFEFVLDFVCSIAFWISIIGWVFTGEGLPVSITLIAIAYNVYDFFRCLFFSQNIVGRHNLALSQKIFNEVSASG
jgi:hypothetical protein